MKQSSVVFQQIHGEGTEENKERWNILILSVARLWDILRLLLMTQIVGKT